MRKVTKVTITLEAEMFGHPANAAQEKFAAHIKHLSEEALRSAGLNPLRIETESRDVVGITEDEARWATLNTKEVKLRFFPNEKGCIITCLYPPDGFNPVQVWVSNARTGGSMSALFNLTDLELP